MHRYLESKPINLQRIYALSKTTNSAFTIAQHECIIDVLSARIDEHTKESEENALADKKTFKAVLAFIEFIREIPSEWYTEKPYYTCMKVLEKMTEKDDAKSTELIKSGPELTKIKVPCNILIRVEQAYMMRLKIMKYSVSAQPKEIPNDPTLSIEEMFT
jgi:hypothetical protein